MGYYAKKIGDVWCVAIDDGREDGHVWGCDDEQQAGDLAEIFNDELESLRSELAARDAEIERIQGQLESVLQRNINQANRLREYEAAKEADRG